ncbi:MAG: transposase [Pontiellaceae bacterium]|nr:transposase [Pontiellaceae bacterium]
MADQVGAKNFSPLRNRRSIRLREYDYSRAGAYFVTACTQGRAFLFGDIADGQMRLNDAGRVVEQCWNEIPAHFPHVALDEFVVMPNHVHGILLIMDHVGAKNISPLPGTSKTIGSVIRGFKIGVTKWFRQNTPLFVIWQRNYYEHIIRNDESLNRIREYIVNNPAQWEMDRENPATVTVGAKDCSPLPKGKP